MSLDLSPVSLVASLLVDSEDRRRNLDRFLEYYGSLGAGLELVLVEQRAHPDDPVCDLSGLDFVRHRVLEGPEVHWATRNRNAGARLASRPFLALVDVDVWVVPEAFEEALARLAAGSHFVQLFNGVLVDVLPEHQRRHPTPAAFLRHRAFFRRDHDLRPPPRAPGLRPLYGDSRYPADGGATACRRESFLQAGGFNENFVSYGFEDVELVHRVEKLGFPFERLDRWNAYHQHHERGPDSYYNQFYRLNEAEYERVRAMDAASLRRYVDQGFRAIELRHDREYAFTNGPTESAWRQAESGRVSLADVCIVVTVEAATVGYAESALPALLRLLEEKFRFLEIRLCEQGPGAYELIDTRAGVLYEKHAPGTTSPSALRAAAAARTQRPWILPLDLGRDAAADLEGAIEVLEHLHDGERPAGAVLPRQAFLAAASPGAAARPEAGAPGPEGPRPSALYLAFDDAFLAMAGACLASLDKHWPDHPVVLVDYAGQDPRVRDWIAAQPRLQPAPGAAPPFFTRTLGTGPVGSAMVHRRFALWGRAFDAFGPILHLDADTLVLGPLDELLAPDRWTILPNHEATPYVRIFDPIFQHDVTLGRLLAEDGLAYPHDRDDLANAGVFVLPRALRSEAQLARLERLAGRYGRYLAYADQSLISLWCRAIGLPYSRDWRYNYQTVFVGDPTVETRLEDVRILHYSSHHKPGTDAFVSWDRLGAHGAELDRLYREHRDLSELARLADAGGAAR